MTRKDRSSFVQAVRKVVRAIPRGRTLSYSEVALRAGKPRGARAVVRALHALDDVPWWRVIRADGTLAREVAHEQAQLLLAEGWPGEMASPSGRTKRSGPTSGLVGPRRRTAGVRGAGGAGPPIRR